MPRIDVWRRRSIQYLGCPAFVPGFPLCGHDRSHILHKLLSQISTRDSG